MNKLVELRARLEGLKRDGRTALDLVQALEAKDGLTDEETQQLSDAEADVTRLQGEVAEAQDAVTREENRVRSLELFEAAPEPRRGARGPERVPARQITSREHDPELTGGFANVAEFARAVFRSSQQGAPMDERLIALRSSLEIEGAPSNFHQEGGAQEGFAVPAQYLSEIWELTVDDETGLFQLFTLVPTLRNAVEQLHGEETPWGNSGIQAKWRAEGTQMTADKVGRDPRMVLLHELYAFALKTEELLADAPMLENTITVEAGKALRWKIMDALIYGSGAGQPLGWFNADCLVSVAKESAQAADTINTTNVLKMFSRMLNPSTAIWLANSDTLPQLGTMTIGNQPAWLPNNQPVRGAPLGVLLGRPLFFTEHAKTVGDKGDIQFVNPPGYWGLRKAEGIQFATSLHLFFDYNIKALRWIVRIGGQPRLGSAVTPPNSSNTKSHFVTLDERA